LKGRRRWRGQGTPGQGNSIEKGQEAWDHFTDIEFLVDISDNQSRGEGRV
jgi:hypothetical protein